jgi:asparagine synthase (glutamine-hydrolysing)
MLRYLGLEWDPSHATAAARAKSLVDALRAQQDWDIALTRAGLAVFVSGIRGGANRLYPLAVDQGVVIGRLFRRSELHDAAGPVSLTSSEGADIVQSEGRTLVQKFWGRYVAFFQIADGTHRLLRDPRGSLPCFVMRDQGVRIAFSWLEDALHLLRDVAPPRVNWPALQAFIQMGALGGRETALEGVTRIFPGEVTDLRGERSTLLWSAVNIARSSNDLSVGEAALLLRETVRSCARAWASCYETILFRLSGGVDSSILLSCLGASATPTDVICVNYHSPGSDSDERSYARMTAMRVGRDLIERERDPDFRLDRVATIARMPEPVHYVGRMNSRTDARMAAAHSAKALFTGAGGDPLFFEYPRWWPAADYLRVNGWDAGLAAATLDAARLGRVSVWKALVLALMQHVRPYNVTQPMPGHAAAFLDRTRHAAMERRRFIHPDLIQAALPIGKLTQTGALMHSMVYYDPLEQDAAPELVTPLMSQPIVELCLGLPTYLLTHGGRGRGLARQAFAADLPPQVATRRSKGGMEEHMTEVLRRNRDFARDTLLGGELARRGLIDRTLIDEFLSGNPSARPGPVGQIHALIGVELWLARWPG